jgi:hypothetical protein
MEPAGRVCDAKQVSGPHPFRERLKRSPLRLCGIGGFCGGHCLFFQNAHHGIDHRINGMQA